jgi:ABC-type polar amino acid transport system ATPase subunit
MFQNLRIGNIKALKGCELLNLGKVNIICGKNNSGKSTLLEGINNPDKRSIGRELNKEDISRLHKESVGDTSPWRNHPDQFANLMQAYEPKIVQVAQTKQLWFGTEAELFAFEVANLFDKVLGISGFPVDKRLLAIKFQEVLADETSTVLLPPKRHLELKQKINTSQDIVENGAGILNRLFFIKNHSEGSPERKSFSRISKAFTEISSGYTFDIFPSPKEQNYIYLSFAFKDQPWIDSKDCGLGLQDLTVLLYFAIGSDYGTILIEEPESHLHPEMQRKLLYFLKEETDKQFFITTHSNIFLDNAFIDRVFFTTFSESISVDDATQRASILDDLGYAVTDNLVSDLVILVEGPSDVGVIEEFLVKMDLYGKYEIKLWPLGGDIMDQLDLSVFAQTFSIIALIDNDPGSKKIREHFKENCVALNIPVHHLNRYAIENYFTLEALKAVYPHQMSDSVTAIEPDQKLEKQIGFNVKGQNRSIARAMSLEDIEKTDLRLFLNKVEEMCMSK